MEINELLNSKIYVKESGVKFPSPNQLLDNFIDVFKDEHTGVWNIETASPIINANTDTQGEMNIAYPRVKLERKMESSITGFKSVVGFIYGLDISKPVVKVYTGQEVTACTNLCIFNAEHVSQYDLLSGGDVKAHQKALSYYRKKEEEMQKYEEIYQRLNEQYIQESEFDELLGNALKRSIRKSLVNVITKGTKLMIEPTSKYFVYPNGTFNCSMWNMYNSFTEVLNGAEIIDKPTKILQTYQLLQG